MNNHLGLSAVCSRGHDGLLPCALNMEGSEKFGPWDCPDASFKVIYKEQHCLIGRACHWYSRDDAGFGL